MAEQTYPFSLDTLGKLKQTGHEISLDCHVCRNHVTLDTDRLIERFGADHGCMDADLRRHFYCRKCREAGRKDKDFAFILHAPGPKEAIIYLTNPVANIKRCLCPDKV